MFRTIKWVVGGIGFLLFWAWQLFLQPIWNINVERWAEAREIDQTVDEASQRVDVFVMPEWLVDSVEFLTGDFLLGFVAASLVFLFLDLCVLLRRRFLGGRKSHESPLQSQNAVLNGNDWAKGLTTISLQNAASAFSNIHIESFDQSSRAKAVLNELLSLYASGRIRNISDFYESLEAGAVSVQGGAPVYDKNDDASPDVMVATSDLLKFGDKRGYDTSWITSKA